jgi:hypothetical protein
VHPQTRILERYIWLHKIKNLALLYVYAKFLNNPIHDMVFLKQRWQLKTSECHSKRGGGKNGLTNQNPPLALPTPSHIPLTWLSGTEVFTSDYMPLAHLGVWVNWERPAPWKRWWDMPWGHVSPTVYLSEKGNLNSHWYIWTHIPLTYLAILFGGQKFNSQHKKGFQDVWLQSRVLHSGLSGPGRCPGPLFIHR